MSEVTNTPEKDQSALERRYRVEKVYDPTGKHADCRYFVLDPQHDPIARKALLRYSALAVEAGHIGLAVDLRHWLRDLDNAATQEADRC